MSSNVVKLLNCYKLVDRPIFVMDKTVQLTMEPLFDVGKNSKNLLMIVINRMVLYSNGSQVLC